MSRLRTFFALPETKPRRANQILQDLPKAKRQAEDERRAAERLYPERKH